MRRSTAAAVGTLTGAALILGVRLSVTAAPLAAPPAFDAEQVGDTDDVRATPTAANRNSGRDQLSDKIREKTTEKPTGEAGAEPTPTRTSSSRKPDRPTEQPQAPTSGLRSGTFTGTAATNPYGTVQVRITVSDGRISKIAASYPTTGESGSINANAIPKLKQATVEAQSADIDAVSGATFTSKSYVTSLQAALDGAARGA